MKTHLATFLLCLVTAAFAEVTEQPAAELFRHKMPKASLSFGYPKEFQYLENRSNETKAVFAGKLDGKVVFFTVLTRIPDDIFTEFPDSVAHARFTERYTLEAAADLIRGSYSPPPKFLSQAYQKLGSLPCVALEHTHLSTDPRKPGWSHRLYGFTRIAQWNRLGIIVSLHCEPEDAERFRATMTAIFASFEFTNQPPSPAVVDFLAGKVTKFSTRGHPKAKEAVFTLKIPAGWSHREAERPNIVQKFVFSADGCTDTVMIITKSFPSEVPFTPKYAKELLAPSELKDSIPEGSTFVTATATKIEADAAGFVEYATRGERAGSQISAHTVALVFFQGRTMVRVECATASVSAAPETVETRFTKLRPLFQQIFNSIVFDDKWK